MDISTAQTHNFLSPTRLTKEIPNPSASTMEAGAANQAKLEQAAKDFEAVFLSEMLKPMWEGVDSDTLFGGGQAEEIYRSMIIDEYGKQISNNGGVGIAEAVIGELLSIQGAK